MSELFSFELLNLNDWFLSTKEKLSESQVFDGLLDYGLFPEKVPSCFTTIGLAKFVKQEKSSLLDEPDENTLKKTIDKNSHDYIRYESLRDINIPRHLGIPHPEAYGVQVLAIEKHWKEIATHCNKPSPQFSRIYTRQTTRGKIFEMNYKGDERDIFEEQEIKWMSGAQYIVHADIASCFPSIYTHSIPWALNGKQKSKSSSSLINISGNLIDKCTQNTKDRQTNGILIGPHSSSIISEIILTSVDAGLQEKGYKKIIRHIDDYTFYASNHDEAEKFLKDLGVILRQYEMSLNDKKTKILSLPRPSVENWIQRLNSFIFQKNKDNEIGFSSIRSFLDLALDCSLTLEKSTPLNYALKIMKGSESNPKKLTDRAKRLYTQEAINLAILYPYLAPALDIAVFETYWHDELAEQISDFTEKLIHFGMRKVYPDTISHALYYALKYKIKPNSITESDFNEIISLEDCITNVLLYEYAHVTQNSKLKTKIKTYAATLKNSDTRDRDRNWLLIFQIWSAKELGGNGQSFLATLKEKKFNFISIPTFEPNKTIQA